LFSENPLEGPLIAKPEQKRRYSFESNSSPIKDLMKPNDSAENLDISVHIVQPELCCSNSIEILPINPFSDTIETDSEDALEDLLKNEEEPITPNPGRNSLSFQYLTTPKALQPVISSHSSPSLDFSTSNHSSPASSDKQLATIIAMKNETKVQTERVRQQLSTMGIHISPPASSSVVLDELKPISSRTPTIRTPTRADQDESLSITEHELNQFELLAEKTIASFLCSQNVARVQQTLERVNRLTSEALGKHESSELLEKYSEKLVQMVKDKLHH
jgi:hypothetical protein